MGEKSNGLLTTLMKFLTISGAAFSGIPLTLPLSKTPKNISPPNLFKNEHTDS